MDMSIKENEGLHNSENVVLVEFNLIGRGTLPIAIYINFWTYYLSRRVPAVTGVGDLLHSYVVLKMRHCHCEMIA